jgi:hypothetical protein
LVNDEEAARRTQHEANRYDPERTLLCIAKIAHQGARACLGIDVHQRAREICAPCYRDYVDLEVWTRRDAERQSSRSLGCVIEIAHDRARAVGRIHSEQRSIEVSPGVEIYHQNVSRRAERQINRIGAKRTFVRVAEIAD